MPDIERTPSYHVAPVTRVRTGNGVETVGALASQARAISEGEFRDRLQEGVGRYAEIQRHGL